MSIDVGAVPQDGATRFRVWAPGQQVQLHLLDDDRTIDLDQRAGNGYHDAVVDPCPAGTRYRYRVDGRELADPASRSQPEGVHGPSAVADLSGHRWADAGYHPRPLWDHVIYEMHVGTFTAGGTFDDAIIELDELAELGVTALEVMPVAQFPGRRNWGYDGVFPFAVQNSYGGPAAFQRFVDACHQRQLAVVLDVVYNHLGPEGNVLPAFGPYFTDRYHTPWGPAVNLDGPSSDDVRSYFLQNTSQWFVDYHVDALRLDAVHELMDRTATPFLADLSAHALGLGDVLGRPCHLIAESADNDPRLTTPAVAGGLGLDAQWNDDFHHALHTTVTGERSGYYADYDGSDDLARSLQEGFVYQGQYSRSRRRRHGAPSGTLGPERFVHFAQNHDHIGNRPLGDRLSTLVSPEQLRLATAVLLLSPGIPLLFMGEEYGETAPFPYFVDHGDPELIEAVREGRAREFSDLASQGQLFDAADAATFEAAALDRALRHKGDHAALWQLHRDLIALRRATPALRRGARSGTRAWASGGLLTLVRSHPEGTVVALFNCTAQEARGGLPGESRWSDLLHPGSPAIEPHAPVTLAPWQFAVYHRPGRRQ